MYNLDFFHMFNEYSLKQLKTLGGTTFNAVSTGVHEIISTKKLFSVFFCLFITLSIFSLIISG